MPNEFDLFATAGIGRASIHRKDQAFLDRHAGTPLELSGKPFRLRR